MIDALVGVLAEEGPPALLCGDVVFSRSALGSRAESVRRALERLGVERGMRVALLIPNHPSFVAALLGAWAAHAAVIPLNPMSSPYELAQTLGHVRPTAVIAIRATELLLNATLALEPPEILEEIAILILEEPALDTHLHPLHPLFRLPAAARAEDPKRAARRRLHRLCFEGRLPSALGQTQVDPDSPAALLLTSGTTGTPRLVTLSHRNLYSNADFIARDWFGGRSGDHGGEPRHRVLAVLPMSHNFGLNVTIDATLLHGGTIVILPRFSAVETLGAMERFGISAAPLVPTMVSAILGNRASRGSDLSQLRIVISGGAALPSALRVKLLARCPGVDVRDTYGLSEASLVACTRPYRPSPAGSVGFPVDDTHIRIVDERGHPLPPGRIGDIEIRGPGVMSGYWMRPPGAPSPFRAGWLSTGDIGWLDEQGALTISERKKNVVMRGGYTIYPREIEELLYAQPGVADAVVIGLPDKRMGERLIACIEPQPSATVSLDAMKKVCAQRLATYKMPSAFRIMKELPRGTTGKISRQEIRKRLMRSD